MLEGFGWILSTIKKRKEGLKVLDVPTAEELIQ
jgi:hypothetical protein